MRSLYYNKLLGRLGYGLPRELWIVQLGIFLNYLGWGSVLPFEVIYLHEGRGFSLGTAGAVIGILTGLAVVAAPVAGPIIDRVGARTTAAGEAWRSPSGTAAWPSLRRRGRPSSPRSPRGSGTGRCCRASLR